MIGRYIRPLLHRARRARGRLEARALRGSVVLLYHRVAVPGAGDRSDPFSLCVSPARFEEHLQVLRSLSGRPPLPLDRVAPGDGRDGGPDVGRKAERGVAITFDDGYADNLHVALPLLERYECPATLFAVTEAPGQEFWWDTMARLESDAANALLAELGGRPDAVEAEKEQGTGGTSRAAAAVLSRLHDRLLRLELSERRGRLEALAGRGGREVRAMSPGELARMAQSDLVTIGGHTHAHADLGALDAAAQLREIRVNHVEIERITGTRPESFAYPFGRFSNFSRGTVSLLREEGFRVACTAEPGVVRRGTDPFLVPRLWVEDWPGDEFERRLRRWLA